MKAIKKGVKVECNGLTLEYIKNRCDVQCGCWIWKAATSLTGYPIAKAKGYGCVLVRRASYALSGRSLHKRSPIVAKCGDTLCVNPAHLVSSTTAKVAMIAAETGYHARFDRRLKISKSKRGNGVAKLTESEVKEIKLSSEKGPVLAEKYGVHRSLITKIRSGKIWKDYFNPYSQLIG